MPSGTSLVRNGHFQFDPSWHAHFFTENTARATYQQSVSSKTQKKRSGAKNTCLDPKWIGALEIC